MTRLANFRCKASLTLCTFAIGAFTTFATSVSAGASYTLQIVAQTGTTLLPTEPTSIASSGSTATSIGSGVSINDSGQIAFQGTTAIGDAIYVANPPALLTSAPPFTINLISFSPAANRLYRSYVQINNSGTVVALDRASNTDFVRTWSPTGTNNIIASDSVTNGPFELVLTSASISNDGTVLFYGDGGQGQNQFACPAYCIRNSRSPTIAARPLPIFFCLCKAAPCSGLLLRVRRIDFAVFRDDGALGSPLAVLSLSAPFAPTPNEEINAQNETFPVPQFSGIGQSPGISDDTVAVAFIGNRGQGQGVLSFSIATVRLLARLRVGTAFRRARGGRRLRRSRLPDKWRSWV